MLVNMSTKVYVIWQFGSVQNAKYRFCSLADSLFRRIKNLMLEFHLLISGVHGAGDVGPMHGNSKGQSPHDEHRLGMQKNKHIWTITLLLSNLKHLI